MYGWNIVFLSCREVGLDCDHVSEGESEDETMKNALHHFWDVHAIKPGEMTSEMRIKIKENIHKSSAE
jgi:predicted small metal-binding protein